jgi:hypothetical protein
MKGIPSLVGVLLGIILYRPVILWVLVISAITIISIIFLWRGRKVIGERPQEGRMFIEVWVLSAIAVMSLCTLGNLWLTVNAPSLIPGEEAEVNAVSSTLVGAVTAFLAILWTKDIEQTTGPFWPSTQFKKAISAAFSTEAKKPNGDTREYEAIFEDYVRNNGPSGWDFTARHDRARILEDYLKTLTH